ICSASMLGQLRGARVEVRTGATPTIGTVVGIEKRIKSQGQERIDSQELVMVSEGGELRSIALDQIRGIKLLDTKVREDLDQYLSILQSTIHKNLRKRHLRRRSPDRAHQTKRKTIHHLRR
ncbi:MAG: hypothetical protein ACRD82_02320, partial [Blastocatellia bacterium]